jgi:hypothetical protein
MWRALRRAAAAAAAAPSSPSRAGGSQLTAGERGGAARRSRPRSQAERSGTCPCTGGRRTSRRLDCTQTMLPGTCSRWARARSPQTGCLGTPRTCLPRRRARRATR